MKKWTKRAVSYFLCLVMLLGVFAPGGAWAEEDSQPVGEIVSQEEPELPVKEEPSEEEKEELSEVGEDTAPETGEEPSEEDEVPETGEEPSQEEDEAPEVGEETSEVEEDTAPEVGEEELPEEEDQAPEVMVLSARAGGGQTAAETVTINHYSGEDRTFLFDENWKFNLGDINGAQAQIYDDASWRLIDLPHDYSIEGEYTTSGEAESGYLIGGIGWYRKTFTIDSAWENKVISLDFSGVYMDCEVYLNGTKLGEHHYGYTPFSFVLPGDLLRYNGENVIAVKTDDAFPSSRWYSGAGIYRSTHLTVTDPVHVAKYGTYVTTTNAGGVTVKTTVENSGSSAANVTVEQAIYELDGATYEKKGSAVDTASAAAANPAAKGTAEVTQTLSVSSPKLWNSWDKGEPNLYVLVTTVKRGSTVADTYETEFGFRKIDWDVDTGFALNGEKLKLKGACQHHDQGGLGSEAWYRALERQVDILMDMGCNSIRVCHNPAADELIEICNRKGVLLIDELFDGWAHAKNGNSGDFSRWFNRTLGEDNNLVGGSAGTKWQQLVAETVVNRDKNAPSVIMYSLCNEVQEGGSIDSNYPTYASELIGWIQAIDNTRYITRGDNSRTASKTGNQGEINQAIHDAGGVVGFNYYGGSSNPILPGHEMGWRMYASETVSHINSRGVYDRKASGKSGDKGDGLLTAYDKSAVGWGTVASDGWWRTIQYDYSAGEYIWTGFDYIGEPTPYSGTGGGKSSDWGGSFDLAAKSSYFGAIDTNGLPKDNYWLYRSMWNGSSHTLHLLPTWDERDIMLDNSGKVEVAVYSDAPVVKLYRNGTQVGSATSTVNTTAAGHVYRTFNSGTGAFVSRSGHQSLYATFNVEYDPGTLEVKAFEADGTTLITDTVGRSVVKTTSGASQLRLKADRAAIRNDGRDLSYVTIDVVDANGEIVNGAKNAITVTVSGAGKLMALDNGVQPDHTSYLSDTMKAGAGQLVAIVQSNRENGGTITVTATANGLQTGSVTISTSGETYDPSEPVSYEISKLIYVQRGVEPDLPETADVILRDGTRVEGKTVTWDTSYDKTQLDTVGSTLVVDGIIDQGGLNIPISVGVTVLEEVAAILNYSAALRVGQTLILPAVRPAVMADGTVVNAQFPVAWDTPDTNVFQREGTVTVAGTADVFGEEYAVTATVRVAKSGVFEGGSVSSAAVRPTVNGVSDANLLNAFDGKNSTVWAGSGEASVAFDTAQNLYRIVLKYSGTVPTSGVTLTLDSGEVTVQPRISGKTATYELGDIDSSVNVTLTFDKTVTLADVELIVGTPTFDVGSTALLDDLKINGLSADAAQMTAKEFRLTEVNAAVEPVSGQNVACTVLPENDGKIFIITESEDHSARELYTVKLGVPKPASATNASNDYPYANTTATAGSDNGGTVGSAVDGSESSIWHSAYNNGSSEAQASDKLTGFPEKRWFQLELQQATELAALRYKPRPSQTNGTVNEYRIEVSQDGTAWTTVATGTWDSSAAWKIAMFDKAVTAKYVKLWGVSTYGDGNQANYFMTAAEVRAVKYVADPKTDLSTAVVTVTPEEYTWTGGAVEPDSVTVTLEGETLTEGTDYTLRYDSNEKAGTAYVYADAVESGSYRGTAFGSYTIISTEYTVTLEGSYGGKLTLSPIGGAPGAEISVILAKGYEMTGAQAVMEDGSEIPVVGGKFEMPAGNVTFSAQVSPIRYRVTYNLGGGTVKGGNPTEYDIETGSFTLVNPTKGGYTFAGWTGTGLSKATESVTVEKGSTGNRVYTATWKQADHTPGGSTGGSSGGGSAGGLGTVTDKPENDVRSDGSTVTTETDKKTGTVTATASYPDGTKVHSETAANGEITAKVDLPAGKEKATVVIPTQTQPEPGQVAVIVYPDGTEEIVKSSLPTGEGMQVTLEGDASLKVVDNTKEFVDVAKDSWAKDSITFVTSREVFHGTGSNTFEPNTEMSRAMVCTVLANLEGADVEGGETWYEKAVDWAKGNGISDGTNPNQLVTREQLAAMLYRYAGSPPVEPDMWKNFSDVGQVSDWATQAVTWAVQKGILRGRNGTELAPGATATRAEVAVMFQRYMALR